MEKKSSLFQTITLVILGASFIIALFIFSGVIKLGGSSSTQLSGTATVWGFLPEPEFNVVETAVTSANKNLTITYVQKDPTTIESDLVEAIASGDAPDLVMLNDSSIWRFRNKLTEIPYQSLPASGFDSAYVQSAQTLLFNDGIVGYPFSLDPIILYWNRDHFDQAGIATPPATWTDVANDIPLLIQKSADNTITRAPIALGDYDNLTNAKDILSMFLFQAGSNITSYDVTKNALSATVDQSTLGQTATPSALDFYTSFSDPASAAYSWNQSFSSSQDAFINGTLSMYFGHASEIPYIRGKNPNLNFDVAPVPQATNAPFSVTSGTLTFLAVPKTAKNAAAGFAIAVKMLDPTLVKEMQSYGLLIPASRAALATPDPTDPYYSMLYAAGLQMKTWLDPDPQFSDTEMGEMIDEINSGTETSAQAVLDLSSKFDQLLQNPQ